jgi:hypothetical protein
VVEHSPHPLKVKGLSPATAAGTVEEQIAEEGLFYSGKCVLKQKQQLKMRKF